ncbi:hypothetical protein AMS68_006869 [Peltaster fructicola]|uniref:Nodulin-like domain-containing protein n=1 Tax=Peltaster fructicola TaxID=286661 RepID=A0A6H0Y2V4_9PEZI|nr:hypothetical protein AMS68_006869 [Peltaster fructicola]
MTRHSNNPQHDNHTQRVLSVIAASAIGLAAGTNYGFSAWAPQFAERLSLSATEINLIGTFGNLGMYAVGIPAGALIDARGPRYGALLGAICLAAGYFPLRNAYDAAGEGYNMALYCLFSFFTGVGSCSAFSSAIKVSATNFPSHRGTATAFPLSCFGLSALLFTTISAVVLDDTSGLLLLLGIGTVSAVLVSTIFLRLITATGYGLLPSEEPRKDSDELERTTSRGSWKDAEDVNITGLALLRSSKFWQLLVLLGLLGGVGLMTINNIGNDARSLWHHYDDTASREAIQKRQLMHVGILSLMSFVGRLCSGIGSDWLVHHRSTRLWTLVVSSAVFAAAQVVGLALENPNYLFWLSGLTGLGYGALFGVYPALVADAFGAAGMASNWGAMIFAPVLSGFLYNLVYGAVLDAHSVYKGAGRVGERVCDEGRQCYAAAYWVTLGSSVLGMAWVLWCIMAERSQKQAHRIRSHDT